MPTDFWKGLDLVPKLQLDDPADPAKSNNYEDWRNKIEAYFNLHNMMGDLGVDTPWPDVVAGETVAQYRARTAALRTRLEKVYNILMLVIEERVATRVKSQMQRPNDGWDAWDCINYIFEPVASGPYTQRLGDEFQSAKYDIDTPIDDYITRVISLARKLEKAGKKKTEDEIAGQILRGLPPRYNGLRDAILNANPEPSIELVCERIRSQELRYANQKKEKEAEKEALAAYTARAARNRPQNRTNGQYQGNDFPRSQPRGFQQTGGSNYSYNQWQPRNRPQNTPYQGFQGGFNLTIQQT
ncbi:hypothetical protein TWF506_008142 [Arthrobotrys conoides]|uniref:Gag protein n=1 Tax=Arthrobotrys conoides TaxID=74498 RepID=A0AAN8NCR2_9PEZI